MIREEEIGRLHAAGAAKKVRDNGSAISGVTLYNQSDDGSEAGNRNTSGFRLLADADNNGSFEIQLVALVDPLDNTSGTPTNTYSFAVFAATAFRAEFTRGGGSGSREVELDALTGPVVPEPTSAIVLGMGGLGLLARRHRA